MRPLVPFPFYGGKSKLLGWILERLPPESHVNTYVEPFGGGGSVLLNRSPVSTEVYNDIDGELVNLFRVIRESPEELRELLDFTPYAREEFALALREPDGASPLERARRYYFRLGAARGSRGQEPGGQGSFTSHAGKASWFRSRTEQFGALAGRLRNVVVENRDVLEVIDRFDSGSTLFYIDPPYDEDSRFSTGQYRYEFSDESHYRLASCLRSVKGFAAVSGYSSALMDRLYEGWDWEDKHVVSAASTNASPRVEALWTNYHPRTWEKLFEPESSGGGIASMETDW